ncbi:MAG: hypothetical protein KJ621_20620 [Proteobacteria bacterium]|nr:hypothetical protein [Pseudomonadota bacterium]MBU1743192.1 hypothetical protein [Pseudomonadota bacterium]
MKVNLNGKTNGRNGTVHLDVGLDDGLDTWYVGTLVLRPGLVHRFTGVIHAGCRALGHQCRVTVDGRDVVGQDTDKTDEGGNS